ncbi:MAG TPA: neutral zinc metallopeptidase [Bryobacteraceae bacterium]|nr:neutral zinc metallopeptidase [Bryobacteraceae bacterium]
MRWTPGGVSNDIEDRRGDSGGFGGGGFGGMHVGIGGAILLGILSLVFHQNLFNALPGGAADETNPQVVHRQPDTVRDQSERPEVQFVSFVLDDVQKNWDRALPAQQNTPYRHARLVLYRNSFPSACGRASMATGPFYCPGDEKVYLDLGFFNELKQRFAAPGEFAQAYVIAHEIGHHVQKILGIETKVRRLQQQEPREANPLSVELELQADCLAGVWAKSTEQRDLVDESDINAAMRAAAAVGDDRLQRAGQGYVNPESFTHGSSAQRVQWFRRGFDSGRISSCNTFARGRG